MLRVEGGRWGWALIMTKGLFIKMKKCLMAVLVVILTMLVPVFAHADDNILSAYGGLMFPSPYYDDNYDSMGISFGASMIRVNEYAGFEMGLSGYRVGSSVNSSTGIGLEALVHFIDYDNKYQPYIAFGMGVYMADFTTPLGVTNDTGSGFIIKTGARYYFKKNERSSNKYFYGVFYKYFTNNMLVALNPRLGMGFSEDVNAGGYALCFEVGVWTN